MEYIRRRHYGLGIPWLSLVVLYYISPLHDSYGIHKYSPCHNLRPVAFNPCTQGLYASHGTTLVPHEEDLDTMACVDDCRREESQNIGLCVCIAPFLERFVLALSPRLLTVTVQFAWRVTLVAESAFHIHHRHRYGRRHRHISIDQ
jgi:hypothetical protein